MLAGIDTMILIWALPHTPHKAKKPTTQDVAEMQRRSRILLHELQQDDDTIVVPTMTVSEWLTGIDPANHGTFITELETQFMLAPFDLPSAALAARLFQQVHELPADDRPVRVCMRADVSIVATAKVAGATVFFSHESRVRRVAELAGMTPKDLPKSGKGLFTEHEMKLPPLPKKSKKKQ